jgi:hypothetical protein
MGAFVAVPLIIAAAFFGVSVFGFGGALLAIPLVSLFLGAKDAISLVLFFQICLGLLIVTSYRDINWRVGLLLTLGMLPGSIAGALLLSYVNEQFLLVFLAIATFAFVVQSIYFSGWKISESHTKILGAPFGFIGGLFHGFIGMGGPVLTMYASVALPEKAAVRATLIFVFFVSSVVRVFVSSLQGLFTPALFKLALMSLPFFLLAIVAGSFVHTRISERQYRVGLNVILVTSSLLMLYEAYGA